MAGSKATDSPFPRDGLSQKVEWKRRTRKQLVSSSRFNILVLQLNWAMAFSQIAIYGSRAGQVSSSWKDCAGDEYGAATFLAIAFLGGMCFSPLILVHNHPFNAGPFKIDRPSASPVEIVRCLNVVCSRRSEEKLRQSPYIASRYPIPGRLRLIPGPAAVS